MREKVHNKRGYLAGHGCSQAQAQRQAFSGLSSSVWPVVDITINLDPLGTPHWLLECAGMVTYLGRVESSVHEVCRTGISLVPGRLNLGAIMILLLTEMRSNETLV